MSLCFLDFDGVLNSREEALFPNNPKKPSESKAWHQYQENLDLVLPKSRHIELLNELVLFDPDLRFVISSSWRHFSLFLLRGLLLARGFQGIVIGVTPTLEWTKTRGREIKEYLLQNKIYCVPIVILDDDSDMIDMSIFHVKVDGFYGLQEKDIEKAKEILQTRVWPDLSNTHG